MSFLFDIKLVKLKCKFGLFSNAIIRELCCDALPNKLRDGSTSPGMTANDPSQQREAVNHVERDHGTIDLEVFDQKKCQSLHEL